MNKELCVDIMPITDIALRNARTLIIQYYEPHSLGTIRSIVSQYKRKNAEAHIPPFISVDVFVETNFMRDSYDKPWLCVVYECLKDNQTQSAYRRFDDAIVVRISDNGKFPLQKLIGGR